MLSLGRNEGSHVDVDGTAVDFQHDIRVRDAKILAIIFPRDVVPNDSIFEYLADIHVRLMGNAILGTPAQVGSRRKVSLSDMSRS
ncbi:hypothetical protein C0063_06720 [Pseudoxanthomonas sp. KAs_5_3]|nr:hypothetical protein C0063_06720 [Pseudoxanthomonas sp. KAs_5_3]